MLIKDNQRSIEITVVVCSLTSQGHETMNDDDVGEEEERSVFSIDRAIHFISLIEESWP